MLNMGHFQAIHTLRRFDCITSSRAFNISQSDPYLQLLGYLDKPVCSSNTLLNADKDQEILKANISLENLFSDFNH